MALARASVWDDALEGIFESDPERAKHLFLQHIAHVQATVPAEKLLVFEVTQGWGPLCKFLGKAVPEQPFPNVNDSQELAGHVQGLRRLVAMLTYGIPLLVVLVVVLLAALLARWVPGYW